MLSASSRAAAARAAPFVFVILWASGFVVARLVRPYAEPESFVALRFGLSALLLAAVALIGGAPGRARRAPGAPVSSPAC